MIKGLPLVLSVAVLLVLLALPTAAQAQSTIVRAEIEDLGYTNLGSSTLEIVERPVRRLVSTTGLMGTGTLVCNANQACLGAGLDGAELEVNQDLQILIDVTGAGVKEVRGRTRGSVAIPDVPTIGDFGFRGTVNGRATCIGAEPNPCQTMNIEMQVRASLLDPDSGEVAGQLRLDLVGQIAAGGWQSLDCESANVNCGIVLGPIGGE